MDQYRGKASTFFTRLGHSLTRKQSPTLVPPSKSLGSSAIQTSPILVLPDELILSILSHISPDPRLTGHHARFRVQYTMEISDYRQQRVRFLRPLSMTCKLMRLRLLPWIWEHLEPSWGDFVGNLKTIAYVSRADISMAASVKFMTVHTLWNVSKFSLFVKCLESLPNLHTLQIRRADGYITTSLEDALGRSKLPQIKVLTMPPGAHPLIKHCHNVEDVDCVVSDKPMPSDEFIGFLASIRNSNIKRLAVPPVLCGNPSRSLAACPRLTELTIIYPHPDDTQFEAVETRLDMVGTACSAMRELVNACKALPDFNTVQIVHFLPGAADRLEAIGLPSRELTSQALREEVKGMKDSAIDCLNGPEKRCQKGEKGKKITLRVIELSTDHPRHHLGSVKVVEYEV